MIDDLAVGVNYTLLSQNLQAGTAVAVRRAHYPKIMDSSLAVDSIYELHCPTLVQMLGLVTPASRGITV